MHSPVERNSTLLKSGLIGERCAGMFVAVQNATKQIKYQKGATSRTNRFTIIKFNFMSYRDSL